MTKQAEAGKDSKPRQQADNDAFASGWDRIFGSNKRKEVEMTDKLREKLVEWLETAPDGIGELLEDIPGNDWVYNKFNAKEVSPLKDTDSTWVSLSSPKDTQEYIMYNHLLVLVNAKGGGEGDGEYVERVIGAYPIIDSNNFDSFKLNVKDARFFKINGCYQSYDGVTWDDASDLKEVTPKIVQVIQYV